MATRKFKITWVHVLLVVDGASLHRGWRTCPVEGGLVLTLGIEVQRDSCVNGRGHVAVTLLFIQKRQWPDWPVGHCWPFPNLPEVWRAQGAGLGHP